MNLQQTILEAVRAYERVRVDIERALPLAVDLAEQVAEKLQQVQPQIFEMVTAIERRRPEIEAALEMVQRAQSMVIPSTYSLKDISWCRTRPVHVVEGAPRQSRAIGFAPWNECDD